MTDKNKPEQIRTHVRPLDETPQASEPRTAAAAKAPTAKAASAARVAGARFLGGVWLAADGSPLTDVETQQAHKAMDAAAAEARRKALLGVTE